MVDHTFEAFIGSPLSMTFGLMVTVGFYFIHGFLAVPGMIGALVATVFYWRQPSVRGAFVLFLCMALWSHNNLLAFHGLMSV